MKKLVALLLLVCVSLCIVSCGSIANDPNAIKANLEDAGYTVVVYTEGTMLDAMALQFGAEDGDITAVLVGNKGDDDAIFIVFSADADAAKAIEDNIADQFDDLKASAAEEGMEIEMGRDGEVVYYGTKAAIKAAK